MEGGLDARPTIEALEEERRRLKELERNLAAERDRVQAAAAREIARMQQVLRDAAERAAARERELEAAKQRLERRIEGGRLRRLVALRGRSSVASDDREPAQPPVVSVLGGRERELAEREARLDEREQALGELADHASAEAARLKDLEASLAATRKDADAIDELEARLRALAARADEFTAREVQLEQRADELGDAERRSAEQLAARRIELDELAGRLEGEAAAHRERETALVLREATLAARAAALEARESASATSFGRAEPQPEPEPVAIAPDLRAEHERLQAKARTLEEAEQRLALSQSEVGTRETAVARQETVLARQRTELDERAAHLRDAEQREAALMDRATVLDAREEELAESIAALDRRERELERLQEELEVERARLAARARRLGEAERWAPGRPNLAHRPTGFSEGFRALARRRGAA